MASLHKDPRGKCLYWYVAFTSSDGQRVFRSTKQRERKKAMQTAMQWEKAADLARSGQLVESRARRVLDDILESNGLGPIASTNVEEFLIQWIRSKETAKAAGTARRYRNTVEQYLQALGHRAKQPLGSTASRDVELLRDNEIREGKSAKTANMTVKTLRMAFNVARRQGLIQHNPAEAVDFLAENPAERATFTREQLRALLSVASLEWKGMILIGAMVGLRIGDAARLTWDDFDFGRKIVRFQPEKARGSKQRVLETPMLPDVERYLLSLTPKLSSADAPVSPTLIQKKGTGANGLSNTFSRLITKAGIENRLASKKATGKGRSVFALSFHSLRHTFVSEMANAGFLRKFARKSSGTRATSINATPTFRRRYCSLSCKKFRLFCSERFWWLVKIVRTGVCRTAMP